MPNGFWALRSVLERISIRIVDIFGEKNQHDILLIVGIVSAMILITILFGMLSKPPKSKRSRDDD